MDEQKLKAALVNYLETGAEEMLAELFAVHGLNGPVANFVDFIQAFCKIADEICPIIASENNV